MLSNLTTYIDLLKQDPLNFIIFMATMIFVILMSLILHECAHGYMALKCGDPTAKMLGRLSLNPLKHLDPFGTISMLLFGFGWAKPVPVNPRNFDNYRRDDFIVSIAGIVTNLTLFVVCALLAVFVNMFLWLPDVYEAFVKSGMTGESFVNLFSTTDELNMTGWICGSVSFEGWKLVVQHHWLLYIQRFLMMMCRVNLSLALFNLLPIPPLDGFHVLNDTLLGGKLRLNPQVFQAAQIVLIVLLFSTDIVDTILFKGSELIGGSVIRVFLMMTGQM